MCNIEIDSKCVEIDGFFLDYSNYYANKDKKLTRMLFFVLFCLFGSLVAKPDDPFTFETKK